MWAGLFVVGVIIGRITNFEVLKNYLQTTLRSVKGMEVWFTEDQRFLIRFNHILDRDRALEGSPYAFEKNLLILNKVLNAKNPATIDLGWCEFHVQVFHLLIWKMTEPIVRHIGNHLGRFVEMDLAEGGHVWGSVMHIQVALDVEKPLRRTLKLASVNSE